MLAIVTPANLDAVLELCQRWEIRASVIGRVTDTARFRVYDGLFDAVGVPGANPPVPRGDDPPVVSSDAPILADVPIGSLGHGPVYDRLATPPANRAVLHDDDPAPALAARFPDGADLSDELLALLAAPTIADKSWVYRQYDHQLFLNTVVKPGGDASVLRLKGTSRALALTTDGKARFCALDPYAGARLVVIEAARNLACVGAVPKALVNCLNFGNPEHPEVMWQFSEVVDGMSDACRALGIPVVGGNVSFYNESRGRDIDPTPIVGVIGLIDELTSVPPGPELQHGDAIVLLGHTEAELGGSEWATQHDLRGGIPPAADLDVAAALHDFVRGVVDAREVHGVHDVSDGGLAVALAEMAVAGGCGFEVSLASELVPALAWFSESTSRVVLAVPERELAAVMKAAVDAGVPAADIGTAAGESLRAAGAFAVSLDEADRTWTNGLPAALGLA
jgi:phosphoribosylformylglycinamidine synthase